MNLQENIHRIQSLLTEDRDEMIKNMIDKYGWYHLIKLMGGKYDLIEPYLKEIDKVNFIKEKVAELGRGGVSLREIGEEPILYDDYDKDHKQVEFLGRDRAYIDIYYRGHNVGDERIPYESLPSEIVDGIFRILLKK